MFYYGTAKEMEKLDEIAVEEGLEIRQMMELAGFHMLAVFKNLEIKRSDKIVIVVGKGNKGGDGLSAARHLFNNGFKNINIILISSKIKDEPNHHLNLLQKMNIPIYIYSENKEKMVNIINNASVLIDSLIGYHLDGPPRGEFKELIDVMNTSGVKIISYDLPSGADVSTGECTGVCIRAFATLILALPKKIFNTKNGKKISGKLYLADIGIPKFLYDKINKESRPEFNLLGVIKI